MKLKFIGGKIYKKELINNKTYEANPLLFRIGNKSWALIKNEYGYEVYYEIEYFETL